jgi:hypothetical protein
MAVAYSLAGVDLGLTYTSNYYATDEIRFGASYDVAGMATVSLGYQQSGVAQDSDVDWYENPFDGVSFGGSLNLQKLIGMNMSVDYALMPAGVFGNNQVIALRMGL